MEVPHSLSRRRCQTWPPQHLQADSDAVWHTTDDDKPLSVTRPCNKELTTAAAHHQQPKLRRKICETVIVEILTGRWLKRPWLEMVSINFHRAGSFFCLASVSNRSMSLWLTRWCSICYRGRWNDHVTEGTIYGINSDPEGQMNPKIVGHINCSSSSMWRRSVSRKR